MTHDIFQVDEKIQVNDNFIDLQAVDTITDSWKI